jgi:hypothetical protein
VSEPALIGILILGLTQVGTFVLTMRKVAGISETRRIEPSPLEVKPSPEYMTRSDCARMHEQNERFEKQRFDVIERRIAELTSALERRNQEGEGRASRIHSRVDEVAKDVCRLDGTLTNHIEHGGHDA